MSRDALWCREDLSVWPTPALPTALRRHRPALGGPSPTRFSVAQDGLEDSQPDCRGARLTSAESSDQPKAPEGGKGFPALQYLSQTGSPRWPTPKGTLGPQAEEGVS